MSALIEEVRTRRRLPPPPMRRAIRQAAGVSQRQVAEELGVDRVTVARWELGTRNPQSRFLGAYLALLDGLRDSAS